MDEERLPSTGSQCVAVGEFTGRREAHVPNQWSAPNVLTDLFAPRLQVFLHQRHELVGDGSVDQAVVIA